MQSSDLTEYGYWYGKALVDDCLKLVSWGREPVTKRFGMVLYNSSPYRYSFSNANVC